MQRTYIIVLAVVLVLIAGALWLWPKSPDKIPDSMMTYCRVDSDCVVRLCNGAVNKEWLKTAAEEPPCATYEGYTAKCVNNTCTAVK